MSFVWMTDLFVMARDKNADGRIGRPMRISLIGFLLALTSDIAANAVSLTPLGDLPGGGTFSRAAAVSDDGLIVVGGSGSALGDQAFIWDAFNGLQGLGDLPGGIFQSAATDVSADGLTVVGSVASASTSQEAFVWNAASGIRGLGNLQGFDCCGEE